MVPQYVALVDVIVTPMGLDESWFKIVYYIQPPLDREDAIKIMEETTTLYRMMGPKLGDIVVTFEKLDKEQLDDLA